MGTTMEIESFLVGPLATNCYIVWDEDSKEAMCIDPGDFSPELTQCIDENGLNLKFVINSHTHPDHAGGNKELVDLRKDKVTGSLRCNGQG